MKKHLIALFVLLTAFEFTASSQFIQKHTWNAVDAGGCGFVTGFCYSKTERNVLYARTDVGGAYRWSESTKSWTRLHDWVKSSEWPLMGIQSMCTDPTAPGRVYMMGGMYNNSPSAIMRSDDYGHTFKRFVTPFLITGTASPNGERLCVDPNNPSLVYCGTHRNGLWKSTNAGETWAEVTSFKNAVSVTSGETLTVSFVLVDGSTGTPGSPTPRIVVGLGRMGNNNMYLSEDAGNTWQAMIGSDNTAMPQRAELSNGSVYVTFNNQSSPFSGTKGGFYAYNLTTKVWRDLTPLGAKTVGYSGLTIDRNNPNHMLITNTSGVKWASTGMYGERIWRTKDGGSSWTDLASSTLVTMDYQGYTYASAVNPHWICNVAFDPWDSNRFFFTSGNGLYRCDNLSDIDASKSIPFIFSTKGLNESVVFDFVAPNTGAELVHCIGDYSGFRQLILNQPGTRFNPGGGANNFCIDVAELNPNILVRTTSDPANGAWYSLDNAVTWKRLGNFAVADSIYAGNIAVSTRGDYMVWAPKNRPMRLTYDNGINWLTCQGIPSNLKPVADKVADKFYAFDGSSLYYSDDGGYTYSNFSVSNYGMPSGSTYGVIRTFPGKEGEVWFPLNDRGLYYSKWSNGTPQFVKIDQVDYCRAIGFGKAKPNSGQPATLFIHGKVKTSSFDGVFRSDDMGLTWIQVNDAEHEFAGVGRGVLVGDSRVYGRVFMSTGAGIGAIYGEINGEIVNGEIETPATTLKVGASQTFTTIQSAYNSISDNMTTSVLIEVQSDYAPENETYPIVLSKKTGATAVNYILIRPASGVVKTLESTNTIVSFNGARYVKLDGRPGGTGTTRGLTLSNTSVLSTAKTIEFINDSYRNSLKYCTVLGSGQAQSAGTIVVGTTTGTLSRGGTTGDFTGSGNLHNSITFCAIANGSAGFPINAVYMKGSPTYTNEGTILSNNSISNFFSDITNIKSCGILNDLDCQTTEITSNHFYQTETRTSSGGSLIYPIYVNSAGNITSIDDNQIGGNTEAGTGMWTIQSTGTSRFAGIYINQVKGGTSINMSGNNISNIDLTSNSTGNGTEGVLCGIFVKSGNLANAVATRPNIISRLTLRFGSYINESNGLCGLSYQNGGGSSNVGYLKIFNLTAIPVGANANTLAGKVMGVSSQTSYGGSCKVVEVHDLTCGAAGSTAAHQVYGISHYTGNNQPNKVERNFIYNLNAVSSGSSTVYGLACGAGSGILTLKNNMVCLGNDMSSGASIRGIYKNTTGADVILHNSVYIGGTATGTTQNTYVFMRDVATENTLTGNAVRNNIFVNKRLGGLSGKHYVLYTRLTTDFASTSYPISCNYNCYDLGTASNNLFGCIAANDYDFQAWKTATKQDANSLNTNPLFVYPTSLGAPNLTIQLNGRAVDQKGDATLTATDDYFGSVRSTLTPCDMGAFAYIYDPTASLKHSNIEPLQVYAGKSCISVCNSMNQTVQVYSLDGRMIHSVRIQSSMESIPVSPGFYLIQIGNRNAKIMVP